MRYLVLLFFVFSYSTASAQVVINEIQISPIGERFIELYNSGSSDVDLTGWYIQRKTATGGSFSSFVSSTKFENKLIKAGGYFLISRSTLTNSDIIVDSVSLTESNTLRIRDSKGNDVDQSEWSSIDDGKSYQRKSNGGWGIAVPTPGTATIEGTVPTSENTSGSSIAQEVQDPTSAPRNNSAFPIEPQIFANVGPSTRTTLVGAPITFQGYVIGLKKEPIENARMLWSFGDGSSAEGMSVSHTYYYPGEYIVVLDASSGYHTTSNRVRVTVAVPALSVRTGGDSTRSFIAIENRSNNELDLSGWQVSAQSKIFILPKSTLLGAHKTLTLASEVTGLATPTSTTAVLSFPNGSRVPIEGETILATAQTNLLVEKASNLSEVRFPTNSSAKTFTKSSVASVQYANTQEASVAGVFTDTQNPLSSSSENTMWPWYIGIAFLGAFGALGIRLARKNADPTLLTAEDFEIIEDKD